MDEIKKVTEALSGPLSECGYALYSVKLFKTKEGLTLQIVVDRDDPISIDDIVKVSDLINPILDREDPIPGAYTLDVSSLGSEKPLSLEKLERYVGKFVHLHLSKPWKGLNDLEGDLLKVDNEEVTLERNEKGKKKEIRLYRPDIDKARLAIKF